MTDILSEGGIGSVPLSTFYGDTECRLHYFESRVSVDAHWPPIAQVRLGEEEGTATKYTCLEFLSADASIVIVLRWFGTYKPILRFEEASSMMWLVAGREVAQYDRRTRAVSGRVVLDWYVDAVVSAGDGLMAICDQGLVRLSRDCRITWQQAMGGAIIDWRSDGGGIQVDIEGSAPVRITF